MAKKIVLFVILAAIAAGGVFGQSVLSMGGGGFYYRDFQGSGFEVGDSSVSDRLEIFSKGYGLHAFVDVKYIEASLGVLWGIFTMLETEKYFGTADSQRLDIDLQSVNVSLLGKFPFKLGNIILFPAAGIEYQMIRSLIFSYTMFTDTYKFNSLWVRFGVGLDVSTSGRMYFRFTGLYGIKLYSEAEKEYEERFKLLNPGETIEKILGHGLLLKAAIGFKF
ncbi:MAG: hypothetical protein FWD26_04180 [Treponema sp.]|nr:hypothetical protein [Treponema sp.]